MTLHVRRTRGPTLALVPACALLVHPLSGCSDSLTPGGLDALVTDTATLTDTVGGGGGGGGGGGTTDQTPGGGDTVDTGTPVTDGTTGTGPALVTPPVVTGAAEVGATLTADAGTWSGTAPIDTVVSWERCELDGSACVPVAGATGATYTVTGDDILHTLRVHIDAANDYGTAGADSDGVDTAFAAGTVCAPSGASWTAPARLEHVIVVLLENRDARIIGSPDAPYLTSLRDQCGSSSQYLDNTFSGDINSLSHYMALTSGSNCNTGLGYSGSGCITDDNSPSSHRLDTTSIFSQVDSWKAYQEDMPSNCDWGNPSGKYWVKHNPPPYYTSIADCGTWDVGIPAVSCSGSPNTPCGAPPQSELLDDLANDTLPEFSFVTPDIQNDMHDGSVVQGDNWLQTYLPVIMDSPAYRRGGTAIYVLWDEQESFNGGPIPNVVISPFVAPKISSTVMNHFAVLRTWEDQLGITTYLGCASGTIPGNGGNCPEGSTTDLRAEFGF